MQIRKEEIEIPGAMLLAENPLPMFRAPEHDQVFLSDGTLTPEELVGLGKHTGFRVLPYRMQDRFTRERTLRKYTVIVVENDILRAKFLPGYGGRLYSLWHKIKKRELIFKNPVFQPANLAIRDAWFSGGIEWNVGQLGHAYHTCDDIYFARCKTAQNEVFIRLYDYVRTTGLFWQVDIHLPDQSEFLYAHIKIINDTNHTQPLYWWTNIAVPEKGCRVFSQSSELIYIHSQSLLNEGDIHCYGHARMPHIPDFPDKDISYPENFKYASEYFFQNAINDQNPWEAVSYPDGFTFLERSTQPLDTRKMFCWGQHSGGRNWVSHLSESSQNAYIEIQAGLTPTQSHGADILPNSEISFTQVFGCTYIDASKAMASSWNNACKYVQGITDEMLPSNQLNILHQQYLADAKLPCAEILHSGHGWAALENMRRTIQNEPLIPSHLSFSLEGNEAENVWRSLLNGESLAHFDSLSLPNSWMVDPAWRPFLFTAIEQSLDNPAPLIYLGVLEYENQQYDLACDLWNKANQIYPTVIALRCLAIAYSRKLQIDQALVWMRQAFKLQEKHPTVQIACEFLSLLSQAKYYSEMWQIYQALPANIANDERILIEMCPAALELGHEEFLEKAYQYPFAVIREGENQMCEIWFRHQAKKQARKTDRTDLDVLLQKIRRTEIPPKNIDFRLVQT